MKAVRELVRAPVPYGIDDAGQAAMRDDSAIRGIAAGLQHARADIDRILANVRQLERDGDVIGLVRAGSVLTLDQAADIWQCSDEKVRKECEKPTPEPIGVKFARAGS